MLYHFIFNQYFLGSYLGFDTQEYFSKIGLILLWILGFLSLKIIDFLVQINLGLLYLFLFLFITSGPLSHSNSQQADNIVLLILKNLNLPFKADIICFLFWILILWYQLNQNH